MDTAVALHLGERGVLGFNILEIAKMLQIRLEMGCVQVSLEQGEPQRLRVILATERIEHADPDIDPFELLKCRSDRWATGRDSEAPAPPGRREANAARLGRVGRIGEVEA